jgi:hypothetical protein
MGIKREVLGLQKYNIWVRNKNMRVRYRGFSRLKIVGL